MLVCFIGYKSVGNKEWVCKICVGVFVFGKILVCLVVNGLKFFEIFDEFKLI